MVISTLRGNRKSNLSGRRGAGWRVCASARLWLLGVVFIVCSMLTIEAGVVPFDDIIVISTAAREPISAFAADMDGDGDLDALIGTKVENRISWHENLNGDGSAWVEHIINHNDVVKDLVYVTAADIDGDGDMDAVAGARLFDRIAWFENTAGDGTAWTPHIISHLAVIPRAVATADVDKDGDMDVLSASFADAQLAWYENVAGDGSTWTQHVITNLLIGAESIHVADIDGDGDIDVAGTGESFDDVVWYENTTGFGATWMRHQIGGVTDNPNTVVSADIDGDGDLDVFVSSDFDNTIAWFENLDDIGTSWTHHLVSGLPDGPLVVQAADVDIDGDIDVISGSFRDDTIAWHENVNGDGSSWTFHPITTLANDVNPVVAADIDGDGDIDTLFTALIGNVVGWIPNLLDPPASNGIPICDLGGPYEAECAGATTEIFLDASASFDPDGDPITFAWSTDCPGASFDDDQSSTATLTLSSPALGTVCEVSLVVSDGTDSCEGTANITIADSESPQILCPEAIVVDPASPSGTVVDYLPTVVDLCDAAPFFSSLPASGSLFPIGTTTVDCTAMDASGNISQCSFTVTVLTPQEATGELVEEVLDLAEDGVLTDGQTSSLLASLEQALASLEQGRRRAGCGQLFAFIQKVEVYIEQGALTAEEGQSLIDSATDTRNASGCK